MDVCFDKMVVRISLEVFNDIKKYFISVQKAIEAENQKIITTAEKLKNKGYDEELIVDLLDEDLYYTSSFVRNSYCMDIVYLYSQIESLLNTGLNAIGLYGKKHFRNESLIDLYSRYGIDLKQVQHCSVVNEIRLVNNCIKHNDSMCNDELEACNSFGWKSRERIEMTDTIVGFYLDEAEKFFKELQPQIENVIDNQITTDEIEVIEKACSSTDIELTASEKAKLNNGLQKIRSL